MTGLCRVPTARRLASQYRTTDCRCRTEILSRRQIAESFTSLALRLAATAIVCFPSLKPCRAVIIRENDAPPPGPETSTTSTPSPRTSPASRRPSVVQLACTPPSGTLRLLMMRRRRRLGSARCSPLGALRSAIRQHRPTSCGVETSPAFSRRTRTRRPRAPVSHCLPRCSARRRRGLSLSAAARCFSC